MLGFGSLETALAFWSCIIAGLFCLVWGVARKDRPEKPDVTRVKIIVEPKGSGRPAA